jgi:hypothetical protein
MGDGTGILIFPTVFFENFLSVQFLDKSGSAVYEKWHHIFRNKTFFREKGIKNTRYTKTPDLPEILTIRAYL